MNLSEVLELIHEAVAKRKVVSLLESPAARRHDGRRPDGGVQDCPQ